MKWFYTPPEHTTLPKRFVDNFIATLGSIYSKTFGFDASFYVSEIGEGGHEIK